MTTQDQGILFRQEFTSCFQTAAEDRYFEELAAIMDRQNQHTRTLKTPATFSNSDDRYCGELTGHIDGPMTNSQETLRQRRPCHELEVKSDSAAKKAVSHENDHSAILMEINSRLARMESTQSAHQGFSQNHAVGQEHQAAMLVQNRAEGAYSVLWEDALSMKPYQEVAEAIRRLDTRVAMQHNGLVSSLADSFSAVTSVCTHVVRQCDALAAHLTQLEVLVTKGRVTEAEATGETLAKNQGTQTAGNDNVLEEARAVGRGLRAQGIKQVISDDSTILKPSTVDASKNAGGKLARIRLGSDLPMRQESRHSKLDSSNTDAAADIPPSRKCFFPSHGTGMTMATGGTPGDGLYHSSRYGISSRYGDAGRSRGKNTLWGSVSSMAEKMSPSAWVFGVRGRPLTSSLKNDACKEKGNPDFSHDPTASSKSLRVSEMSVKLSEEGGAAQLMFGSEAAGGVNTHESFFSDATASHTLPRYYRRTHWATDLIVHDRFTNLCLLVVFFHALYIGMEANWNAHSTCLYHSGWFYIIMSNVFCTFYVLEWSLHLVAFSHPKHAVTEVTHLVDTVLAFVTALYTWVVQPILFYNGSHGHQVSGYLLVHHVVRLVFLARFARFVKAVPELLTLTRGIVLATKALFWTFAMLACVTYMFGIVMHALMYDEIELNAEMGERNFATLENAMWTLVVDGALIDEFGARMTIMLYQYRVKTSLACISMAFYMFIAALTILNMLIGVMSEVVNKIAALEKNEAAVALMRRTILKQLMKFDDGNGMISKFELELVMSDEESESVLQSLNVDRLFLLELQQMLFPSEGAQVNISTVVELMLLCRGDQVTTVRTFASGLLYISSLVYKLEAHVNADTASLRPASLDSWSTESLCIESGEPIRDNAYTSEESKASPAKFQAAAYESEESFVQEV